MSRAQLINALLDRMARDMAEDIIKHNLTERESHQIAACLASEAIHHATKLIAEEKEKA
jgi:uncharacterized membrane protein